MSDIQLVLDGVPEESSKPVQDEQNALAAQKVLSEVEKLSAEEQAQVEAFAKKIDLHKSEIITNYGATIQKQSAAIATKTLQDVKTKNTGEISALLVEMVVAMDGMEGGKDQGGFLSNFFKKVKGAAITARTKNESAEKTLERIEKQLEGHNIENARSGELAELYAKAQASGLPEDAMLADNFAKNLDQFEKQVHNLRLTRTSCLQSAPQIRMIQHNDQDMTLKLQSSIVNTMPLWRKKIAMSIAINNNLQAAQAANAVDDLTNKMLREQAAQFHLGVVESAKSSQRSIIDIETIDYVNKEITGAVLDYISIEQKGAQDRKAAVQVIANSERELVQGILSATAGNQ